MTSKEIEKNTHGEPEIVGPEVGPQEILSADDLATLDRIAAGETVDNVDVTKLDHGIQVGLAEALTKADKAMVDVAGFMGAALRVKTWMRIPKADGTPYLSELDYVETQISAYPVIAAILKGTEARQAMVAAISGITDAKGREVSLRRMGQLLGVSKTQVALDRDAAGTAGEGGEGTEARGPQDGGEVAPTTTAAKRYVSALENNAAKVRDAEQVMTAEQLLAVAAEGRDLVKTAIATLRLRFPDAEVPEWAEFLAAPAGPGRLRSGAEGTVGTGPVLKGAPVDPTGVAAPAPAPKPKPKARAAS